jgi:hypothetical protein
MDRASVLEAMVSMDAVMGSNDAPNLEELEKEHPGVIKSLKEFERDNVMSIISALLTYPQFHANTIRLEAFQQLTQRNCVGKNKPTRHRIEFVKHLPIAPEQVVPFSGLQQWLSSA